jgi:hypothetical protein
LSSYPENNPAIAKITIGIKINATAIFSPSKKRGGKKLLEMQFQ